LSLLVSLMVVPPVVLLVPLFVFGAKLGWISTFRLVILIYVGLMLPFSVYMLTAFFRTIPRSLIEAATIDGASSWAVFRRIVLPLSAAPLVTLAVVNLLWVWNELLIALVFLQDDTKKTLMVGITGFQSRYNLDVPAIMSGLTLATLPVVTLYVFSQRFFVRGLVSGALKD
jgi:ABC-type glycerol-3-phosphate transport system permease component